MKGGRCVLIDGHSLAYRAFYALPADLATSSGQVTNAVYGFTSMLIKVLEDLKPDAVIVAFDKGKPEFRMERYADYKAQRKPMPDELRDQMDLIHGVLEALDIPIVEEEGYEADDILATLVAKIGDREIYIVTGDRDALQLVDERVRVVANRRGITDIVIYDPPKVKERYGVSPEQIVDYLALKGDTSDNIPGIPGIGEKTAAALIGRFGSLDEIYDNLEEVEGKRWRNALESHRESALLSRELANLRDDVPVDPSAVADMELVPWEEDKARAVFSALEFKNLYERLESIKPLIFEGAGEEGEEVEVIEPLMETVIENERDTLSLRESYLASGELSFYARIEGEGYTRGRMGSLSLAAGEKVFHLNLEEGEGSSMLERILAMLEDDAAVRLTAHRGKEIMVQSHRLTGRYPRFDFDVQLASYLISPSGVKHDLEGMLEYFLGSVPLEESAGQLDLLGEKAVDYRDEMRRALAIARLVEPVQAQMNLNDLEPLYEKVEMPLQKVLADMEIRGIRLDIAFLREMEAELKGELEDIEGRVFEIAGEEFNLNSPQQLSHILFEVLELPPQKRTKTGYATDVSVLNVLRELHPIADLLLRHRELSKLKNTYVGSLPLLVDSSSGRLHASFNQTVTATGRLSSSNPNLQNIPIRTPLGKRIRKAFIPSSDQGAILSADYSQIELRIMAHLSGDRGLKQAFEDDLDIHASTAAEVFGKSLEEVDSELRRRAKAINFGIIYGISPFGLAEQLGIEQDEAEAYIDDYFRRFPGVREYLDRQVGEASRCGYVKTLMGRRREIPELAGGNRRLRSLGERLAFNTPIQGSAADIIKVAMIRIHDRIEEGGFESGMILQVHDELVFDVAAGETDGMAQLVREEMEGACQLDVPLKVDLASGPTWYDTK